MVIDNYDSFTYNLVQALGVLGARVDVFRNDAITASEVLAAAPDRIVVSPGPCTPAEAGESVNIIKAAAGRIPVLGVCLGHQAIAGAFGGRIIRGPAPVHGKASQVDHDGRGLFRGLPSPLTVGRYHSLIVDPDSLPPELRVTARTGDGIIMAVKHVQWPLWGVQFHPESVLTPHGNTLLSNFLEEPRAREGVA
ncbi:MAG: aminodeoxychorismate/anthranilate synthase component II [Thermaerobacterales bacterium]